MKINKRGWHALNFMLLLSLIIGYFELIETKTLVAVFIIPAFIIPAALRYKSKKSKQNAQPQERRLELNVRKIKQQ